MLSALVQGLQKEKRSCAKSVRISLVVAKTAQEDGVNDAESRPAVLYV